MRVHVQRVSQASVTIEGTQKAAISTGLLLLMAANKEDSIERAEKLAEKCLNLRIFPDDAGKMNLSVKDIKGDILVISNFTLYGDCRKGNRPNFMEAAPPDRAEELYDSFVGALKNSSLRIETGTFGAMMDVALVNEGPVTLMMEN